jgi:peptide-methionine (R)-S-oxide reductase
MSDTNKKDFPIQKSDEEWKQILSPLEYEVLRNSATERPFSGEYYELNEKGIYACKGCGIELFTHEMKFDAHCGWPSFDSELPNAKIIKKVDRSHGMIRTEICCSNCGGHLGHLFNDGPTKTGQRYCVNSVSLQFLNNKKDN